MINKIIEHFKSPNPFLSRDVIGIKPIPVPHEDGIYAFYFKNYPKIIRDENTIVVNGYHLLYVGTSSGSNQKLRERIINRHLKGDASVSALRTSLGCLLADKLGMQFIKEGGDFWYGDTEELLDQWLDNNARFAWFSISSPRDYEKLILKEIYSPLNIIHNKHHSFCKILKQLRAQQKESAKLV